MNQPGGPGFLRAEGDATLIAVRLTPRGGRDAIEGITRLSDGRTALAARVRAVPENGAANAALLKLLAGTLAYPPGALSLAAGATSRLKTVRIAVAYQEVGERLAQLGVIPQG
jgi:uncharacterized protein